ncbi:MAG TPA: carbamoyltransferase N-terminal domain-containing protein, partial [Gammaproteobacteria bacterium]|nr:carbamoyltransferase N-terminal domain-containing protein [Gammaproteobacteria bacterium]
MTCTLGINAAYHDSAACLVRDGEVVGAAEEERFTRIKHGKRPLPFSAWELPYNAIDYCLAQAGIELADCDHVAYSYDPYLLLDSRGGTITLPLEPSGAGAAGHDDEGGLGPWGPLFLSYIVNAERQLLDGAPHHLRKRFGSAKERRR